jgi:hypothetical protein
VDKIEAYAVKLVAEGGESTAEDDMNEMGEFTDEEREDWIIACDLGVQMAHAVGRNAESFTAWYRSVATDG